MRIAIGSDHAGFPMKKEIIAHLEGKGITVTDLGTHSTESTDYPGYAHAVAMEIQEGSAEMGIVICGSGNGVNITANRHAGIRSALAWNIEVSTLARQHNDANVLALPARFIPTNEAIGIVDAFLQTPFEGGRHERRVKAIEC